MGMSKAIENMRNKFIFKSNTENGDILLHIHTLVSNHYREIPVQVGFVILKNIIYNPNKGKSLWDLDLIFLDIPARYQKWSLLEQEFQGEKTFQKNGVHHFLVAINLDNYDTLENFDSDKIIQFKPRKK